MQISLDSFFNQLPDTNKFPTNKSQSVGRLIETDFNNSDAYTIVTGYSSLEFLISFLGKKQSTSNKQVRIVLGNEPIFKELKRRANPTSNLDLDTLIIDFWLEQGISPLQSVDIVRLIEFINTKAVDFRILEGLHAKIYIGKEYAMLGSSNFSRSGFYLQLEANHRVHCDRNKEEYKSFQQIANHNFDEGTDYNRQMIDLLKRLLSYVTWREALARAVAELTEGEWLKQYPEFYSMLNNLQPPLWKTQIAAIGQALYILDNNGSLLIADPTGSGKTRLGAVLHACILNRLWLRGNGLRDSNTLLISPPQVLDNWQGEFRRLHSDFNNIVSHGELSQAKAGTVDIATEKIKNAKILFIDEAHNFLNRNSKRSLQIQDNFADNLVLYTATPINRRVEDLFRLIEILDVDNLSDEALRKYEELSQWVRKGHNLSSKEVNLLRDYIKDFIIRRTKKELNRKVDENPEEYRNNLGKLCRYPEQNCKTYKLNEPDKDIEIAKQINEYTNQLRGVIRLRNLHLKPEELKVKSKQEEVLHIRMKAAKSLTVYSIQAMLRSSRIALIEHLKGTDFAKEFLRTLGCEIPKFVKQDKETGNILARLEKYKLVLPKSNISKDALPSWFKDADEYAIVCEKEIEIYENIFNLAVQLTDTREKQKAKTIANLFNKHELVLSFDSRIISLYYIEQLIKQDFPTISPIVVTGSESETRKREVKRIFELGSKEKKYVGLCSDVMAEGVNLQQASVVVLLDVPSVMRLAEQRIGRVDRMNSPHRQIEVYFPDDQKEFALKTDKRFFTTAQTVDNILGGNIALPEELVDKWNVETITAQSVIRLYETEKEKTESSYKDGIEDAFKAVKDLVFGENALIDLLTYNIIKPSKATLLSKVDVSKVQANKNFAFFCIRGSDYYAPFWLYLDEDTLNSKQKVIKELPKICKKLRENLSTAIDLKKDEFLEKEQELKELFVGTIIKTEIDNLPNKKRRAIQLLLQLVDLYLKPLIIDPERKKVLDEIKKQLNPKPNEEFTVDLYSFAKQVIALLQPRLIELKKDRKNQRKVIHMNSKVVLEYYKKNPVSTEHFFTLIQGLKLIKRLDKRIASCIIGIKTV